MPHFKQTPKLYCELPHDKTNEMACVPSEESDQIFAVRMKKGSLGTQRFCWFCHEVALVYFNYFHESSFKKEIFSSLKGKVSQHKIFILKEQ